MLHVNVGRRTSPRGTARRSPLIASAAALLGLLALVPTGPLAAQGDCTLGNLPDDSHEAEIFKIRGVSTAFGRAIAPTSLRPKGVLLMFEVSTLQEIDSTTATPTYCRPGKPAENINLLGVLPRPRVIFGIDDGMTVEASWIPPIPVNDVKANVFGIAIARTIVAGAGVVSLRGAATLGEIRAPITCTEEQIAVDPSDPGATECAGGDEPSSDHYKPNSFSLDLSYARDLWKGRVRPYVGGGVNFLRPRFQVDFVDQFDVRQAQKVEGNFTRPAIFGGATVRVGTGFGLSGEYYTDPGTAWTARFSAAYLLP
jgi:hypothetical protein